MIRQSAVRGVRTRWFNILRNTRMRFSISKLKPASPNNLVHVECARERWLFVAAAPQNVNAERFTGTNNTN